MKTLKNAGIAVIISLIIGITSLFYIFSKIIPIILSQDQNALVQFTRGLLSSPAYILVMIIGLITTVFLYKGFIYLGRKTNNKLLVNSAWTMLIVLIAYILIGAIMLYSSNPTGILMNIISTIEGIIMIILMILLGVSILRLKDKVELSKITGILLIISGATMIIAVGAALYFVALVFVAIMFFKASKKFDK